ncbi:MAG: heparinase II/III family protein [Blastocatellia bacterium]
MKPSLILRTLPYLRWEQIFYRPLRMAQFRAYGAWSGLTARWRRDDIPAPAPAAGLTDMLREVFDNSFPHLSACDAVSAGRLRDLAEGKFTFLNRPLTISRPDWNQRYDSHLWNYQFHYFGYVVPAARAFVKNDAESSWGRCRELIESWIDEARPGRSDGWDAYPVSVRVVNWLYAYTLVERHEKDQRFLDKWRGSIYRQLDFLSSHMELHLLANHLLENARTLTLGGLFFADDPGGRRWLELGEHRLWREFAEQVLDDGGHYERSPMYHALALAGFLECFALLQAFRRRRNIAWTSHSASDITKKLRAMARFLEVMTWPDGTLALFNDAANTGESRPLPILDTAEKIVGHDLEPQAPVFPETGYYAWFSADDGDRIVVDCGEPAVDYNMAHAHCDILSYELWLRGRPVVVDSGTHGYGGDPFREYCRSTRAHNTVMFDGLEQSEVWGTFRMARRAEIRGAEVRSGEHTWDFRGSYAPYHDKAMRHERSIRRNESGEWLIEDIFDERNPRTRLADSFIHLHPGVRARRSQTTEMAIECEFADSPGDVFLVIEPFGARSLEIIEGAQAPAQGWYFPEFGVAWPAQAIRLQYTASAGQAFGYRMRPASFVYAAPVS